MKTFFLFMALYCMVPALLPAQNANDHWDSRLDTARRHSRLSNAEKDFILELNKVRSDPPRYADLYIKPRLNYFNGLSYNEPGNLRSTTKEGRKAVEECIEALSRMAPVPILYTREGLVDAAQIHARDMMVNKFNGHRGSDGSSPNERINRYGRGIASESLYYGMYMTIRDLVITTLINDGTPSRSNRATLMNKDYNYIGFARADSDTYTHVYVLLLSSIYASFNNREEMRESETRLVAAISARNDPDRENWNVGSLDTANDVNYLTSIEKDIILEINKLRSDPQKYVRLYLTPENNPGYNATVNSNTEPLYRLSLERGLYLAAKDTNGDLRTRLSRYGNPLDGRCVEVPVRGFFNSGKAVVIQLLDSNNRTFLMTREYGHIGVSVRTDPNYGLVAVFDFAEVYISK